MGPSFEIQVAENWVGISCEIAERKCNFMRPKFYFIILKFALVLCESVHSGHVKHWKSNCSNRGDITRQKSNGSSEKQSEAINVESNQSKLMAFHEVAGG
jgi:hypothetical protein